MSRFFSSRYAALTPYIPGEQPRDQQYVKLNTNESPFPPSPGVAAALQKECQLSQLYPDPECTLLRQKLAQVLGVEPQQVLPGNGSDEILSFAVQAFADEEHPLLFPDITYGFYPVFAQLHRVPYEELPLKEDFSIDINDYISRKGIAVIANPNAPTGLSLELEQIELLLRSDPDRIVIVDEAYVAFGGKSAVPLLSRYENLLIVGTFSKSHSLAGGRLGYAVGSPELITDLNTLKYSFNPYNVNRLSAAAGAAALEENQYYTDNCARIMANRAYTAEQLGKLGFSMIPSTANFIFARHERISGNDLYLKLKQRGVLIRHLSLERIRDWNRITVGTREQMDILLTRIREILEEEA